MTFRQNFRHRRLLAKILVCPLVKVARVPALVSAVFLMGLAYSAGYNTSEAAEGQPNSGVVLAQFSNGGGSAYQIGAQDILDITVFNVPELSKTLQVADTGTINFPLLGEVSVGGKTARQVEQDLTARLGADYLQNPQVTVYVKENNSRNVTISGAVKKPGVYPLATKTSLLQAIAIAGDLDESAETKVLVLRSAGGKQSAAKFDIRAIQSGRMADPPIKAGDRIVVGQSAIKKGFNTFLKAMPIIGSFALF